ncbi:MAG: hypothetical protein M3Z37_05000 [Candidatus Eremiobacteraeota bacterium]|nr:hypothetical protein [Candidatus Eremiobacteraeota bacterium]
MALATATQRIGLDSKTRLLDGITPGRSLRDTQSRVAARRSDHVGAVAA